jgi:alpha-glucan,water dikinase
MYLGTEFKAADYTVNLFSEELIRGSLFFTLSMVVKKIDSQIRQLANLGDWLLISRGGGSCQGELTFSPTLLEKMDEIYQKPTILIVDKITGEEEVPEGVVGIILNCPTDYPDVLAHVSVRARNLKVILAVNFSEGEGRKIKELMGKGFKISLEGPNLKYQEGGVSSDSVETSQQQLE